MMFGQEVSYQVGDVIEVSMGRTCRFVKVDAVYSVDPDAAWDDDDQGVKNGEPGFDGTVVKGGTDGSAPGASVWGYSSQVVRVVVRRAAR